MTAIDGRGVDTFRHFSTLGLVVPHKCRVDEVGIRFAWGPPVDSTRGGESLRASLLRGEWHVAERRGSVLVLRRTARAGMTRRQMQVLERAASGRSLKEIGALLAVHPATVCNHLRAALEVLGATRAEAIMLFSREPIVVSDEQSLEVTFGASVESTTLTRAEREVVLGVVRGLSNEAIARQRGCATRTVANLLARAFRKSGAQSRNELVARFVDSNPKQMTTCET